MGTIYRFLILPFMMAYFGSTLSINISELRNFNSIFAPHNLFKVKHFTFYAAHSSYHLLNQHRSVIVNTCGLIAVGLVVYKSISHFLKMKSLILINQNNEKNNKTLSNEFNEHSTQEDDSAHQCGQEIQHIDLNRRYFTSPTQYFLLSTQIDPHQPYGIVIFENGVFKEKIAINNTNVAVLNDYKKRHSEYTQKT